MEEVDGIIVRNLRSIGCDIDEDVHSLGQFTTELIVEAVARCLHSIDNSVEVSYKLPPSMAARFRVGTNLANAVQGLGYHGDVGYHTFLYSNEIEIRRVLMFLVDHLPKEHSESAQEPVGSLAILQKSITAELSRRLALPWIPPFCQKQQMIGRRQFRSCHLSVPHDLTKPLPKVLSQYYKLTLPYACHQPIDASDFPAAILEENARCVARQHEWETEWSQQGLASRLTKEEYKAKKREKVRQKIADQMRQQVSQMTDDVNGATQDLNSLLESMGARDVSSVTRSRFTHAKTLQFAQEDDRLLAQLNAGTTADRTTTEAELQKKRQEEIESLKAELIEITSTVSGLESDMKKLTLGTQNIIEQLKSVESGNQMKEDEVQMKRKLIDLLPDADTNIRKLEALVEASSKRLVSLANQWEKHRLPLLDEYRSLKELSEGQMNESQRKIEEIKEMQEKMKELITETRDKDGLYKQLVAEYDRMTRDVNRSAYTQRIMEIVANIRKQNEDIDKVLGDTKSVQKEINQLSGVLDRTFAVTDELIFRDAKRDENVRKSYKFLAALHENCSMLIKSVEETGVTTREIRELEDQLETESKKNMEETLDKITTDYQEMRKDNVVLLQRLKHQGTS
jgi:hypothetical protein